MMSYMLWMLFNWAFQGLLHTCRFLWICPYNTIAYLKMNPSTTKTVYHQIKQPFGFECKSMAAIPGSYKLITALHTRLTKTEKEVLSLKTRMACERALWERRFNELQRRQEELFHQMISEVGITVTVLSYDDGESGLDDAELFEECSDDIARHLNQLRKFTSLALSSRPTSALSPVTRVCSRENSPGPHRVFVPHSPMDLQLGHQVRIMLPSGRVSTGTIRFLGNLQGEPDVYLGVELQTPDHGLHDGNHEGHSYFECKPGYGAFVPFSKLLMTWE